MHQTLRRLTPVIILFAIITGLLVVFSSALRAVGFDVTVLIYANIILLLISVFSFIMQARGLKNSNPNVFIRSVMGGMMLKMLICVAVIFAYVSLSGPLFSKRSVFASLLLYLVYLAVESAVIMKLNKSKNA